MKECALGSEQDVVREHEIMRRGGDIAYRRSTWRGGCDSAGVYTSGVREGEGVGEASLQLDWLGVVNRIGGGLVELWYLKF